MRTGIKKSLKTTEIFFDEGSDILVINTYNTSLKNRLTAYARVLYAVSDDGYHFSEPKPYVWDDGSILENYNTQQKWMIAKDGLFLVYNRKGANNDHIFRHRAPLFMTRFDEERECLVRSEEVILVPEMGARLGNFCVFTLSENEAWLSVAEWMQRYTGDSHICANYGSNNALWISRVRFGEKPI